MCGIGVLFSPTKDQSSRESVVDKMHHSLAHRGPDGFGIWSSEVGVTLFHRRLAIIDVSEAGRQPMTSQDQRWILSFNGEIYNHRELRPKLESKGLHFNGHSDSEVLLAAVQVYGVHEAIKICRGMFAIILVDSVEQNLFLIRDRLGEKPLYYGHVGRDFVAGSELKVFAQHPEFKREINSDSIASFLKYNYIPAPDSIYQNIKKVPSATILQFSLKDQQIVSSQRYWQISDWHQSNQSQLKRYENNFDNVCNVVHQKLREVVSIEMCADVPLGCFLSGGVDSSLIAALMQSQSTRPIKTFSIGFENPNYNEAPYAREIAKHLKTDHTEWTVTAKQALDVVQKIPDIYDEPFSDSSQIPTFVLSQLTRSQVTVALSGDGGDELFAGYTRYQWANRLWATLNLLPAPIRKYIAQILRLVPISAWDFAYNLVRPLLPRSYRLHNVGFRVEKALNYFAAKNPLTFYDRLLSHWYDTSSVLLTGRPQALVQQFSVSKSDLVPYMMWHDALHYLQDDIMVKVDRASMASSLETRAPFLEHELVDLVHSLPREIVRNARRPKQVTKAILESYVPRSLFEREKMGFGIPLEYWLRNELKDWMTDLLSEERIKAQGIFDPKTVSLCVQHHLSGRQNFQYHLWDLLVFQMWYDRWLKHD